MRTVLPVLLIAIIAGCQDTSPLSADVSIPGGTPTGADHQGERADNAHPCPLLGTPTTVRYEIQTGTERQYVCT